MLPVAMSMLLAVMPIAKGSGEKMCVLTPADFHAVGLVADKPHANVDDGGNSVYCIYRGVSGAMGGIELDVFYPAGASPADIVGTWKTMLASNPGVRYQLEGLSGVDASLYSLAVPQAGHPNFAANAVRRGDLIFTISMPSTPKTKAILQRLSGIVLQRLRQER